MQPIDISLTQEMKKSYLEYSMSVIIGRALPDVRDGMKPVHRRILWGMSQAKFGSSNPHRKSARVTGEVMGKYHPHGDQALYLTIARMAQNFSTRYLLIDGQGNFGSVDGDPPAASRYTECRLEKLSEALIESWDEDTVNFRPNFDNTLKEPIVLPAALPSLMLNGSVGISVGMATNMPPYNLKEVTNGIKALIDNPDLSNTEMINYITGPDFPTGGIIYGKSGILSAYNTGYGKIIIRGKAEIVDPESEGKAKGKTKVIPYIKITEIPYQVNKADLVIQIDSLKGDKTGTGNKISRVVDYSDMDGMEIRVEYKSGTDGESVLNYIYSRTRLQTSFSINNIALVGTEPKQLKLIEILQHWIDHREDVITRRSKYRLEKAKRRLHILEGLKIAMDNIDEIIAIIRSSDNDKEIYEKIKSSESPINILSDEQIKAILELRLRRLSRLEKAKVIDEIKSITEEIEELNELLSSKENIMACIKSELTEKSAQFEDDRRTEIVSAKIGDEITSLDKEKLIPQENVVVILTEKGYFKVIPVTEYKKQHRGGKGKRAIGLRSEDVTLSMKVCSNHDHLLIFTNVAKVYKIRVFDIDMTLAGMSRGTNVKNLVHHLEKDEIVTNFIAVNTFNEDEYLLTVTAKGMVKRTVLSKFSNIRKTGIRSMKFKEADDRLINVGIVKSSDTIILGSRNGKAIHFKVTDVRPLSRGSMGVHGMNLSEGNEIVGVAIPDRDGKGQLLSITENGYGKRTPFNHYRIQKRNGKGLLDIDTSPQRNGPVVGVRSLSHGDELMLIDNTGKAIRIEFDAIRQTRRNTKGVRVMRLAENNKIVALGRIQSELIEEENENSENKKIETADTEDKDAINHIDEKLDSEDVDLMEESDDADEEEDSESINMEENSDSEDVDLMEESDDADVEEDSESINMEEDSDV